jgi:hypothetical protein
MRPNRFPRVLTLALVVGSLFAGGFAFAANNGDNSGAGNSGAVKPGKGCGDKNHYHEREGECKKPPR